MSEQAEVKSVEGEHQAPQQGRPLDAEEQTTLVHTHIIEGHATAIKQLLAQGADADALKVHVAALTEAAVSLHDHLDAPTSVDHLDESDHVTHVLSTKVESAAADLKEAVSEGHHAEVVETHVKDVIDAANKLAVHHGMEEEPDAAPAPAVAAQKSARDWSWVAPAAIALAFVALVAVKVFHL